jgi:Alcohol dehydrogenase GroES-like domain
MALRQSTNKTIELQNQKMKALIYGGPGSISIEERPRPKVETATDAVVKIVKTTICGTDLHILKGDVPTCTAGRTLGHEGIGVVEEVGNSVSLFKSGDRVLISCITSCGKCEYCKRGMYSHCASGGWILGHTIDGTQSDSVCSALAKHSAQSSQIRSSKSLSLRHKTAISVQTGQKSAYSERRGSRAIGMSRVRFQLHGSILRAFTIHRNGTKGPVGQLAIGSEI